MGYLRSQTNGRVDWEMTRGNVAAQRFYESLGATQLNDVTLYRWALDDPLRPE
jgi:hypothetical protein